MDCKDTLMMDIAFYIGIIQWSDSSPDYESNSHNEAHVGIRALLARSLPNPGLLQASTVTAGALEPCQSEAFVPV